jgi:hypothetical protein
MIRKMTVCGLSEGTAFSWPDMKDKKQVYVQNNLNSRKITGFQFNASNAIYSLKVHFSDENSMQFGSDLLEETREFP